jgi:hypothetical protein
MSCGNLEKLTCSAQPHKKAADLLIKALNDRSGSVRSAATWYLGEVQDQKAVRPLLLAIHDRKCDWQAMDALRNLLGGNLEYEMIKALSDSDPRICVGAATVLFNFRRIADSTSALIKMLRRNNWKVRRSATFALGESDSIEASRAIIESFKIPESNLSVIDAKYEALNDMRRKMQNSIIYIENFLVRKHALDA